MLYEKDTMQEHHSNATKRQTIQEHHSDDTKRHKISRDTMYQEMEHQGADRLRDLCVM